MPRGPIYLQDVNTLFHTTGMRKCSVFAKPPPSLHSLPSTIPPILTAYGVSRLNTHRFNRENIAGKWPWPLAWWYLCVKTRLPQDEDMNASLS